MLLRICSIKIKALAEKSVGAFLQITIITIITAKNAHAQQK